MTAGSEESSVVLVVHPGAEQFGSDRMAAESVAGLRAQHRRVVVALPTTGSLVEQVEGSGAEVRVVPMLVLRKALLSPRGWPRLLGDAVRGAVAGWRLLGRLRPDAVYVSTITVPLWPLLARLRRARTVSHVHEAEASGRRLVNVALYFPHLAAHRVLVNSTFAFSTMRRDLPLLARRAKVVLNGVASPDAPRPPRRQLDGSLNVLYLGRLSPRKGPDLVIEAAARLRAAGVPVRVTLVGTAFTGYEQFERYLHELADRSGVEVDFAGFHADVWPFLEGSDVLVVPSRIDEPFGNTAVEGVLALRPVIASDSSGLREAAGGYTTARLVPPGDAAALADALEAVRDEWPRIVEEVAGARDRALARHAPERYRAQVAEAVAGYPRPKGTRR